MDDIVAQALKSMASRLGEAIDNHTTEELKLLDELEKQNDKEVSAITSVLSSTKEYQNVKDTAVMKLVDVLDNIRFARDGVKPSIRILKERLKKEQDLARTLCSDIKNCENSEKLLVNLAVIHSDFIDLLVIIRNDYRAKLKQTRENMAEENNHG